MRTLKTLVWAVVFLGLFLAVLVGRVFIIPRVTGIPSIEGSYEAMAHMFVGFALLLPAYQWCYSLEINWYWLAIGVLLSLWELGWFLAQR